MIRLLWILLLILAACQGSGTSETDKQEGAIDVNEVFMKAFNSPECTNPCWLGIEVGETNQETVIAILTEQGIEYGIPGVIHLHSIPDDSVPGINLEGISSPDRNVNVYGDINVGQRSDDIVQSIDFFLDLCVPTVVDAYGMPSVRSIQKDIPTTLAYLDHQLLFFVDTSTLRIDGVILHMEENMPSLEELEDWPEYADTFSGTCSDVFTES